MARILQLNPAAGAMLDPGDQFPVEHPGDLAKRATQQQVIRALLSQPNDGAVTFPAGSYGSLLVAGGAGPTGSITTFASTPGPVVETGLTVVNPQLAWTLTSSMSVASQSLAGPLATSLNATQRNVTLSGNVTADATWTLTVVGSAGTLTKQHTLAFGHTIHYGRGVATLTTSAAILALAGSKLATNAVGDYIMPANPGSSPYWWFCYPDSWGTIVLFDAATGFQVAITNTGTVSVTNANGHVRAFRCLRSLNALNAGMTVRIN